MQQPLGSTYTSEGTSTECTRRAPQISAALASVRTQCTGSQGTPMQMDYRNMDRAACTAQLCAYSDLCRQAVANWLQELTLCNPTTNYDQVFSVATTLGGIVLTTCPASAAPPPPPPPPPFSPPPPSPSPPVVGPPPPPVWVRPPPPPSGTTTTGTDRTICGAVYHMSAFSLFGAQTTCNRDPGSIAPTDTTMRQVDQDCGGFITASQFLTMSAVECQLAVCVQTDQCKTSIVTWANQYSTCLEPNRYDEQGEIAKLLKTILEGGTQEGALTPCLGARNTLTCVGNHQLPNARSSCLGYHDGEACAVICNDGYDFSGTHTCSGATLSFTGDGSCEARACSPLAVANVRQDPSMCQGIVGDTCTFECMPGYIPDEANLRCDASGRWVRVTGFGRMPQCIPQPCTSNLQLRSSPTVCAGNVGDVCAYTCDPGYAPAGEHVCGGDLHFSGGLCRQIDCEAQLGGALPQARRRTAHSLARSRRSEARRSASVSRAHPRLLRCHEA